MEPLTGFLIFCIIAIIVSGIIFVGIPVGAFVIITVVAIKETNKKNKDN